MEPEREEQSVYRLVSQTMRLYFAQNYRVLEKLQIHPGQASVLFELHRRDGLYQRELCDILCVRPSTVTVMIRRMEKSGLLRRQADRKDQRMVRIFLTEKGEAAVRRLAEAARELEETCFAGFSREELLLLKRFVMQIKDNLSKLSGGLPEHPKKEGTLC